MFALIETKGATHIIIGIPHEGAEKSLPAITRMFEQNSIFIKSSYYDKEIVKPEMTIKLGDSFDMGDGEPAAAIACGERAAVPVEPFEVLTPELRVSYKKIIDSKNDTIKTLSTERDFLKQQNESLKSKLAELEGEE